jgi:hypothetical protein
LGGKGIGREGMLVREGSRVVWIEETQRKTMVCGVKEGSDRHHVSFSSLVTCSMLPFVLANASAFLCCMVVLASIAVFPTDRNDSHLK